LPAEGKKDAAPDVFEVIEKARIPRPVDRADADDRDGQAVPPGEDFSFGQKLGPAVFGNGPGRIVLAAGPVRERRPPGRRCREIDESRPAVPPGEAVQQACRAFFVYDIIFFRSPRPGQR